jgi:hypothetical protein
MPYIKTERRTAFEKAIQSIVDELGAFPGQGVDHDGDAAKGELNYVIYSIIKRYLEKHGMRYARAQNFIGGVLTCCQFELYRRLLAPYEDNAIFKNGDV